MNTYIYIDIHIYIHIIIFMKLHQNVLQPPSIKLKDYLPFFGGGLSLYGVSCTHLKVHESYIFAGNPIVLQCLIILNHD